MPPIASSAQAETGFKALPPAMTSPGGEQPLLEEVVGQFLATAYKRLEETDFEYCPGKTRDGKTCKHGNGKAAKEIARALHNQFSKAGRHWKPKKFVAKIATFLKHVHCGSHQTVAYKALAKWKSAQGMNGSVERVKSDAHELGCYKESGSSSSGSSSSNRSSIDTESTGHAHHIEHPVKNEHAQEHGIADTPFSHCPRGAESGSDAGVGKDVSLPSSSSHSQLVGDTASSNSRMPDASSATDIETQMSALAVGGPELPISDLQSLTTDQILEPSIEVTEHDTVKSGSPPSVLMSPFNIPEPSITSVPLDVATPESSFDIAVSTTDVAMGCVCQPASPEPGSIIDLEDRVDRVLGQFAAQTLATDSVASTTSLASKYTLGLAHGDRSRRLCLAQSTAQRALWCAVESKKTRSDDATGTVYIRRYEGMNGIIHIGWTCGMCKDSGPGCYLTKTSWVWDSDGEVFGANRITEIMAAQLAPYRRENVRCALSPSCQLSSHDEWFQVDEEFTKRLLKSWVWFVQQPAYNPHGELTGPRLAAWSRILGDVGGNANAAYAEAIATTGSSYAPSEYQPSVERESTATNFEQIIGKIGSPQSGNASMHRGDEYRPASSASSIKSRWTTDRSEYFQRPRRLFSGRSEEKQGGPEVHDLIHVWQMLGSADSGDGFQGIWDTPTKKKKRPSLGSLIPPKFWRSVGEA